MSGGVLVADRKWLGQQHDRSRNQREHTNDVEAVHECKQVCLRLQLGVDVSIRSARRFRRCHAVNDEVMRNAIHPLLQLQRSTGKICTDN